jgi:hypothetical protein
MSFEEEIFPLDFAEYKRSEDLFRTLSGRIYPYGISTGQKVYLN